VSAEGIDTAITCKQLAICFLDKAHVTKMTLITQTIGIGFKRFQTLTQKWLD